jgi:uncharacterized phage protein (TIGR02220 family)
MPQRFLKPGITTSKKWCSTSWVCQSFYIRLLTLVDDYGRYDAEPVLLKSHAFPLREDIRASQVSALCKEMSQAQLAIFYKADGKMYVQLTNWTERVRADESKFPAFDNTCQQMFADDSKCSLPPSSSSPPSSSLDPRHLSGENGQEPVVKGPEHEILDYLNQQAGRQFAYVEANLNIIRSRLREVKGDVAGIKQMIERWVRKWQGTEYEEYLQPSTLFAVKKFRERYDSRMLPVVQEVTVRPDVQLKALEEQIEKHPANRDGSGSRQDCTQADKDAFVILKKKRQALIALIANGGRPV